MADLRAAQSRLATRTRLAALVGALVWLSACTPASDDTATEVVRAASGGEPISVLSLASAQPTQDARRYELQPYVRQPGINGKLSTTGSDTISSLMTLWAEAFKHAYPNVNIEVQVAGSSTAPPALTEGTVNFGPMSRAMKDREIEAFESRHGYRPTAVRVALDALAVFVHKDNPLRTLTLDQVDAIFSMTRRCGSAQAIDEWGGVGLAGSWENRPIQLFGRNSVSGTYGYFKRVALCSGDFRSSVNEQPGSASVVQAVSSSLNGIGYSGMGYLTSGVNALGVATDSGVIHASTATARSGAYPLTRYLYIYMDRRPGDVLPEVEREFLRMVLSAQGQAIVAKDGFIPLAPRIAQAELDQLG
ncbi:MAG: phosphate ABC transporter substrate-binding protein [Pseudomonadota bacterium]